MRQDIGSDTLVSTIEYYTTADHMMKGKEERGSGKEEVGRGGKEQMIDAHPIGLWSALTSSTTQ